MKQDLAVGQQIYDARKAAGLTQAQLARRIGTTQSVISDLEDAEYDGHSLAMLRRIADALDLSVRVSFVPSAEASPAKTSSAKAGCRYLLGSTPPRTPCPTGAAAGRPAARGRSLQGRLHPRSSLASAAGRSLRRSVSTARPPARKPPFRPVGKTADGRAGPV